MIAKVKNESRLQFPISNCQKSFVDGVNKQINNDYEIYLKYAVESKELIHYVRLHTKWDQSNTELVYEAFYDSNCTYKNIEHDFDFFERRKYIKEFENQIIDHLKIISELNKLD
ncbi:hypothetical protein [Flammeovirga sp. SJP92]|uniref:hypothetical protein n=1 Tax=Flammeovirga sp. SJP92 TaxID=1775430 RepID=UPI0012F98BC2|nr:hypothetical protein [Flammeovirga sp. SJP92]